MNIKWSMLDFECWNANIIVGNYMPMYFCYNITISYKDLNFQKIFLTQSFHTN